MRFLIFIILNCLLIIPGMVMAHGDHGTKKGVFTKHFNESLFKITEKGLFSVEIVYDDREYVIGKDLIGIIIHDENDEDAEGAVINVTVEGILGDFFVKEKGGGLYTVSNLSIKRAGEWKLIINVKHNKKEDRAIFIFPDSLLQKIPKGRYEFKHAHHPHRHEEYTKIINPITYDERSIEKGRDIFNRHCAFCHSKLVKKGDILDLTDDLWIHGDTDGEIFMVISEGIPDTQMRSFKDELSSESIWHIVNYLKSLKPLKPKHR